MVEVALEINCAIFCNYFEAGEKSDLKKVVSTLMLFSPAVPGFMLFTSL